MSRHRGDPYDKRKATEVGQTVAEELKHGLVGARSRIVPPEAREEDGPTGEEEDEEQYDEPTDEEARRIAFLIRAGEALRSAVYEGPPEAELAKAAYQTAEAWMNLATKLEG